MAVLQNEHKKIQYMIDSLVLPFLKNQHPKWRELIRVYLEFLDEHPLNKALNITDNVDANTMYSDLLDEFLNLYFKDVVDINKFGLNDDNKRLFISLSKLIGNLKATKTSYGFFFNSFTDFSIPTDGGDINVDDMTVTLEEKPEWWLTNNDPTRPFTYIFKIDNTNLSNLKELIKEVHPAGWIQLFLMEVAFEEFMTGYDCFELDIHWGAYHNGKWNHDAIMTIEGVQETLYHDGGYTRSDPINCAPKPRWFSSAAAIQTSIISVFTPGALEITLEPEGGHFMSSPANDEYVLTVEAGPQANFWQWYKDDILIPNADTDTLTISGADETDTANYYVMVGNGGTPIQSAGAYLVVTVCPIAFNDDFNGSNDDPPDATRWVVTNNVTIQENELYQGPDLENKSFDDDFTGDDDDLPNPELWNQTEGDLMTIQGNQLQMRTNKYRGVSTTCTFQGDFDIQVDWNFPVIPNEDTGDRWYNCIFEAKYNNNNFASISIGLTDTGSNNTRIQGRSRVDNVGNTSAPFDISGLSQGYNGILKMTRIGTDLTLYSWNDPDWIIIHTRAGFFTNDVTINLKSTSVDAQPNYDFRWDNFLMNVGTQSGACLLEDTASVTSTYELFEDFTAEIDYELATPTLALDSWQAAFEFINGDDYIYQAIVGGDSPSQLYSVIYSNGSNQRNVFVPWPYETGKFRIERYGDTVELWAWNIDDGWVMSTSYSGLEDIMTSSGNIQMRSQSYTPDYPIQYASWNNLEITGTCQAIPYLGEFEVEAPIVTNIPDVEMFNPIYSDSFEGADGTQPDNWNVSANSPESASIFQNTIRFISSGGETPLYKVNNFKLNGDFDIAWNYGWNTLDDSTWASYIRVGGATNPGAFVMYISVENYDWLSSDPPVVYHTRSNVNNGGSTHDDATGQTGKIRVKRIGNQQYSYFWDAGTNGWVLHARCPMTMSTTSFTPYMSFHSDTITANVDAWLYNFQVYSCDDLEYI